MRPPISGTTAFNPDPLHRMLVRHDPLSAAARGTRTLLRGRMAAPCLLGAIALSVASAVCAAPRVPTDDAVVLERVPAAAETRRLEPVRRQLEAHPEDAKAALALAQGYLDLGRATSDPRFVSYAQAVLAHWVTRPRPDPQLLTLEAGVEQYLHRFDVALRTLDRALATQPANAQALLIKATILQVQGHFDEGRAACRKLVLTSGQLIALTCLTSVDSLSGKLDASYGALRSVYSDDARLPSGLRVWILDILADMAARAGDPHSAEGYLRSALEVTERDPFSKAAYADLLLQGGRDREVIALLRDDEAQDNLLLRLAIAGTRLQIAEGARWATLFQQRYEAARRDGDVSHLREQARFVLEVRHDARQALALAERNWQVQREPADVRIYFAAATAAGDANALRTLQSWMAQVHYEDRTLDPALRTAVALQR